MENLHDAGRIDRSRRTPGGPVSGEAGTQFIVEAHGLARQRLVRQVAFDQVEQRRYRLWSQVGTVRLSPRPGVDTLAQGTGRSFGADCFEPDSAEAAQEAGVTTLEPVQFLGRH